MLKGRLLVSLVLFVAITVILHADEPVDVGPLLEEMASAGHKFDPTALDALGTKGLTAVLDRLYPPSPSNATALEKRVSSWIGQLGAADMLTREQATQGLIDEGIAYRHLVEAAGRHKDPEVRHRVEIVLSEWGVLSEPRESTRYSDGFVQYLKVIQDTERLDLLAERTVRALQVGMPDEPRRQLIRSAIARLVRTKDERYLNPLVPLLKHKDEKVAVFVVETVGGFKDSNEFFPDVLMEALRSDRAPVVDAAISWTPNCWNPERAKDVHRLLRQHFQTGSEEIRFHACFPLMHDFKDAEAFAYLLEQTQSTDEKRAHTAIHWVGDACNSGNPLTPAISEKLVPLLKRGNARIRRAASYALGTYSGEEVVKLLIPQLVDVEAIIGQEAASNLIGNQRDAATIRRLLEQTAASDASPALREKAQELLAKLK